MKKIINGKVYDTDTAKQVAEFEDSNRRDFGYIKEILFVKKTGEYFIYGEGGPMTKYAISCGQNQWQGGSKIIPLTYQAAREWAEEKLDADEYEAIFGEIIEEEGKETITWSLSSALVAKLRREAQEAGISIGALVEQKLA